MAAKKGMAFKLLLMVFAGAVALVYQALPLSAKKIPAEQVRISTPVYVPAGSYSPKLGRYSYDVSWNGIPAGSVELEFDRNGDDYEIKTKARTAKAIDMVFKLRYEAETIVSASTLKPKYSTSVVRTNSKKKTTELKFLPDGEIRSVSKDHRGRVRTLEFDPDNFTLDPYSIGLLALSQEWKVGDKRSFDMFSGKSRYLIEFTADDKTEITVNGLLRQAIVLRPTVKKLTDTSSDADDKKLREARIYISADHSGEILKISSDLLIGSVDTVMVGFSPAPGPENDLKSLAGDITRRPHPPEVADEASDSPDFPMIVQEYPLVFVAFITCSSLFLFSHDQSELFNDIGWTRPPMDPIRRSFIRYSEITSQNKG